ncbi:hypothetical protein [Aquitalea denitrificans]|uniref:hypothetical protein n=1 Tax=Aquitalea denitrificans TaxID=519081 RepID=UPI0013579E20|nr:hypothetical protein [Aquitalea denitrificans]
MINHKSQCITLSDDENNYTLFDYISGYYPHQPTSNTLTEDEWIKKWINVSDTAEIFLGEFYEIGSISRLVRSGYEFDKATFNTIQLANQLFETYLYAIQFHSSALNVIDIKTIEKNPFLRDNITLTRCTHEIWIAQNEAGIITPLLDKANLELHLENAKLKLECLASRATNNVRASKGGFEKSKRNEPLIEFCRQIYIRSLPIENLTRWKETAADAIINFARDLPITGTKKNVPARENLIRRQIDNWLKEIRLTKK